MVTTLSNERIDQAASLRRMVESSLYPPSRQSSNLNIPHKKSESDILLPHREQQNTHVITITSGKGGVGKSSISLNLGLALVQAGKRVLLFDADLGLANINIMMGIIPKHNLYHVLKESKKMEEIIINTPEGLDIIPGASGYSSLADLNSREREKMVEEFSQLRGYDVLLVDTGAGIGRSVVDFALPADDILVVTTPEPTSITDAYGIVKSIVLVEPRKTIKLIVNRTTASLEGRRVAERVMTICSQFLNYDIDSFAFIFEDEHVAKAVRKQKPFYLLYPKSKASSCLNIVVAKILENKLSMDNKSKGSISGFFQRLFQVSASE